MTGRRRFLARLAGAAVALTLARHLPGIAPTPMALPVPVASDPSPFPFKPFAEFPAPIDAMQTMTTNGNDTLLLVTSGGNAYVVDKHGTVTRL